MFYHIDGVVSTLEPYLAVIDCGGVGYALNTTLNSLGQLRVGQRAKLYTYLQVREDVFELYVNIFKFVFGTSFCSGTLG